MCEKSPFQVAMGLFRLYSPADSSFGWGFRGCCALSTSLPPCCRVLAQLFAFWYFFPSIHCRATTCKGPCFTADCSKLKHSLINLQKMSKLQDSGSSWNVQDSQSEAPLSILSYFYLSKDRLTLGDMLHILRASLGLSAMSQQPECAHLSTLRLCWCLQTSSAAMTLWLSLILPAHIQSFKIIKSRLHLPSLHGASLMSLGMKTTVDVALPGRLKCSLCRASLSRFCFLGCLVGIKQVVAF